MVGPQRSLENSLVPSPNCPRCPSANLIRLVSVLWQGVEMMAFCLGLIQLTTTDESPSPVVALGHSHPLVALCPAHVLLICDSPPPRGSEVRDLYLVYHHIPSTQ